MTSAQLDRAPRLPPRWFIRAAWATHRALYSVSGGRLFAWSASSKRAGILRLRSIGRRSGLERKAILGYVNDGPNLVLVAMNGWGDPEPAWLLNLQANPNAAVDLREGSRTVVARATTEAERSRLWARLNGSAGALDRYAVLRSRPTQLVVLEPR